VSQTFTSGEPPIHFVPDGGTTRAELRLEERAVSRLWIVPFTLCIGAARVRMDGIGGVGTDDAHRRRGYSRRVLEATVGHMQAGAGAPPPAALSMLYGIRDFYPKFGYATAGPDHDVRLRRISSDVALPTGWTARPIRREDLPAVRGLYERNTALAVGANARKEDSHPWKRLAELADGTGHEGDACRVVADPTGRIVAYAWRGTGFWSTDMMQGHAPEALVLAEVMADGPAAADAVLATCRAWAVDESRTREKPLREVILSMPPEGPVAAAAMRQDATFRRDCSACGSSMARVLDVARLLDALRPELARRLQAARLSEPFAVRVVTEIGEASLTWAREELRVAPSASAEDATSIRIPQEDLARLALGAFAPEDVLARLESPPDEQTMERLAVLFPQRHPHMWLPDRY
jgi:predicted acetyltransferase